MIANLTTWSAPSFTLNSSCKYTVFFTEDLARVNNNCNLIFIHIFLFLNRDDISSYPMKEHNSHYPKRVDEFNSSSSFSQPSNAHRARMLSSQSPPWKISRWALVSYLFLLVLGPFCLRNVPTNSLLKRTRGQSFRTISGIALTGPTMRAFNKMAVSKEANQMK